MFSLTDVATLREEAFQKSSELVFRHLKRRMIDFHERAVKIPAKLVSDSGDLLELTLQPKNNKKRKYAVFHQNQWCRVEDVLTSKGFCASIEEHHILVMPKNAVEDDVGGPCAKEPHSKTVV